ncbi:MAG: hybrid sensor histidine kinase/response regulator, partial [Chloroflexota bacterium]|nr:hybrid sensor histidine kinase/response regulator [Chloroflexota bacterium]
GRDLVLVVEDHPELRAFVTGVLSPDHRVAVAEDGREALARARAERPDLIVTDVMMPGMNGEQLLGALRADPDLADVPVVVLSAWAEDELRVRLLRAGAQDYLVKPFAPEELRARVGNLLAMVRARDLLRRELRSQGQDVAGLAAELAARKEDLAAAVRALDEFLSVAAHELRTPVTVVKGMAEHLVRGAGNGRQDPERTARHAARIAEAGNRLAALTEDLLDVSRLRLDRLPLRPERLDLGAMARDAVARFREGPGDGRRILLDVPDGPCWVDADPGRLGQVLDNLLDNALKYSPDGGEVAVAVRAVGDGVELSVRDGGIGLPPGSEQAVFEPFGRAANATAASLPGLGLGLAICRGIVERHYGRIRAESAGEGQGTTVSVWLPGAAVGATKAQVATPAVG